MRSVLKSFSGLINVLMKIIGGVIAVFSLCGFIFEGDSDSLSYTIVGIIIFALSFAKTKTDEGDEVLLVAMIIAKLLKLSVIIIMFFVSYIVYMGFDTRWGIFAFVVSAIITLAILGQEEESKNSRPDIRRKKAKKAQKPVKESHGLFGVISEFLWQMLLIDLAGGNSYSDSYSSYESHSNIDYSNNYSGVNAVAAEQERRRKELEKKLEQDHLRKEREHQDYLYRKDQAHQDYLYRKDKERQDYLYWKDKQNRM